MASADPYVIPGVGPRHAQQEAEAYPPSAQPSSPGQYGGGFLEMLMTGASQMSQPAYPQVQSRTYQRSAIPDQGSQMTAYADPQTAAVAPRREIDPIYMRQEVDYSGSEHPGTIVVDTPNKFLFYVEPGGRALRYGIGVGRPGFSWSGVKAISRKAEWPGWTPPAEMLLRRPDLPSHMEGGPANPLGARALYLGSSLYRIHGTNEPYTIGTNVSSGCIRMMNEDVEDLYNRVHVGTKVIVM
jgi:lipoprotein-anchoring transpeptidase ErfK/SrfK